MEADLKLLGVVVGQVSLPLLTLVLTFVGQGEAALQATEHRAVTR